MSPDMFGNQVGMLQKIPGMKQLAMAQKLKGADFVVTGDVTEFGRNELAEALAVLIGTPQHGHGRWSIAGDHVGNLP